MIEKSRRKKHPRAHPHFVWADPSFDVSVLDPHWQDIGN
jgi:hypothetical protein